MEKILLPKNKIKVVTVDIEEEKQTALVIMKPQIGRIKSDGYLLFVENFFKLLLSDVNGGNFGN